MLHTLSASSAIHCRPTLAGQMTSVPAGCISVGLVSSAGGSLRSSEAESCLELRLRPRRRLLLRIRAMVVMVLPRPCTPHRPCHWRLQNRQASSCYRCCGVSIHRNRAVNHSDDPQKTLRKLADSSPQSLRFASNTLDSDSMAWVSRVRPMFLAVSCADSLLSSSRLARQCCQLRNPLSSPHIASVIPALQNFAVF